MTNLTKASKKLSYLLRHAPAEEFKLDEQGWALCSLACQELKITREQLQEIVDADEKGRYRLTSNGESIRAVQGHSTSQVNLAFPSKIPPDILFHGTPARHVTSILESGLNPGERHYVHLSTETATAERVGLRGSNKAAILEIDARRMVEDGILFYVAENDVWLVDKVIPPKYLKVFVYRDK